MPIHNLSVCMIKHDPAVPPVINCILLSHANAQQLLLQVVNIMHLRLINSLLDDIRYLIVDQIEVRAIRWP